MSGILSAFIGRVAGVVTDAYFNLVTLLLPGNGTNGAQNNTFLDSSTNNFTITRNGNTTQGTFSPFSQTGWSVNLDGTGDYLTVADNAVLDMGSSNFTMEFWTYITGSLGTYQALVSKRASTGTYGGISLYVTSSRTLNLQATLNGSTWGVDITTTSTVTLNEWAHIAVVRNGNVWTVYINGTSGASTTVSGTVPDNSSAFTIGAGAADGGHNMVAAYISNFRLVKGTALYTANFTPSTSVLTTTSQGATATEVELLTCQGNRFVDISSNAFTITVNGNPSIQAFSPFAPTAAYSAATVGGSGYFDGTGDYLSAPNSTAFDFSTADFTLAVWVYPTTSGTTRKIATYSNGTAANSNYAFTFEIDTSNKAKMLTVNGTSVSNTTSTPSVITNAWNYLVVTRSGATVTVYVNGTGTSASHTTTINNPASSTLTIGAERDASVPLTGYMCGLQLFKGVSTAPSSTNPTSPATSDANTSLLLNFTNAGITDATAKNDLETVGNAQISTTQSKFGGSSMYFDGTGDWLTVIDNPNLQMGSGDFTIEGWFYLSATGVAYGIASKGTSTTGWSVNITSGNKLQFSYTSSNLTGATTLSSATWYYFAVVRSGTATGNLKVYLNGSADATSAGAVTDNFNQTNIMYIGADRVGGSALNGYIDDLRITKGFARTIATPSSAFPLQ